MSYSLVWNLDTIFPGGSASTKLQERLELLNEQIATFTTAVNAFDAALADVNALQEIISLDEQISGGLEQCGTFIEALNSANTADQKAKQLTGTLAAKLPAYQLAANILATKLGQIQADTWENLTSGALSQIAFRLNEIRKDGADLLPSEQENIINTLSLDGLKAWSQHYDTIVAQIKITTVLDGQETQLSAGQAFNLMMSSDDSALRQELFNKWEAAWQSYAPLFADTLNHIDGFRLSDYKLHNVSDHLQKAREYNRLSQATLDQMWATIAQNKQPFVDFLNCKAKLLGKEQMCWQDQDAPVTVGDFTTRRYSFDQAADFIIENFAKFSPKMASFAKEAFEKAWIEAEDRPGKRPGGYCAGLPETKESRIFMTYGESVNEVATLAHELGHAFHSSVMWDLPHLNQQYAMNVAETASTFAELIVADATLKQATSPAEKLNLLDVKIQNAIAMFMNIHARYIFENNFYQARQQGLVSADELNEMMVSAQKQAYANSLANYHPLFWAAKLHFYIDDVAFYNFPYTFGYLFSLGIYAKALQSETSFEDQYIALLRDTASMNTEDLAKKHLNVDLTKPDFWQAGIDMIVKDIEKFITLSKEFI